jgi:hypothetical protein
MEIITIAIMVSFVLVGGALLRSKDLRMEDEARKN